VQGQRLNATHSPLALPVRVVYESINHGAPTDISDRA
jgi:hypothetical protein